MILQLLEQYKVQQGTDGINEEKEKRSHFEKT